MQEAGSRKQEAINTESRVAQSVGIGGLDPSIAKELIDSVDPKHTLVCRDLRNFRDDISIL